MLPPAPGLGSRNATGSPRVQDRCPGRGYHFLRPLLGPCPQGWLARDTREGRSSHTRDVCTSSGLQQGHPESLCPSPATLAHPKPNGYFLWPLKQTAHPQDAHLQRAPGHLCSLSAPVPQAAPVCPGTVNQLWPRQSSCNRIGSNTVSTPALPSSPLPVCPLGNSPELEYRALLPVDSFSPITA